MIKEESSGDKETGTEVQSTDTDNAETSDLEIELETEESGNGEISPAAEPEGEAPVESDTSSEPGDEVPEEAEISPEPKPETEQNVPPKPRRSWFGFFNFLLILVLAGAAGYYWWQQQQVARDYESALTDLEQQLASKAENARLESSLSPLKSDLGSLGRKLDELGVEQQGLRESSEKLYELYGRDKNDWQLAEVEYLMRVAQHKLILQDDFEGAAITLQAASDRIALTADPGLLPVRVKISEEIADLKTRKRADLVGMTLILAQLRRQVRVLEPGFALRVDEPASPAPETPASQDWFDRFNAFIDSLVKVRNEATQPSEIEANIADVGETLEDNLKLARWAVLERDGRQYLRLIEQSLRLFREFYDLDNAANHDFMTQLQELQKMELKPEKPDITGSLRELLRILSQRENEPQPDATEAPEPDNG
ncbi:MAG: uroporphyrinogen-III C-methyltransferase [Gammaproteobacteria bacterium]|nr:uroporphyrinogen-III C-methyltransferase [Gammaproteobacteria bacterium]MDH3857166.1 uroporphyrinogen-III C-methyltransferase [Gammaproteobacteria bacterium]